MANLHVTMLYETIYNAPDDRLDEPIVIRDGSRATWRQVRARADELIESLADLAGRPVGLALPFDGEWLAAAAALDRLGCRSFLVPVDFEPAEQSAIAAEFELAAVIDSSRLPQTQAGRVGAALASDAESSVVLLTSGTSARPKAALHTWRSLASGIHRSEKLATARMLLSYDAARYAGLQVVLTALLNGSLLCVPVSRRLPDVIETIISQRVNFVSGTPTFWRMLLANGGPEQWRRMALRQVTLGGEPIGQGILDALRLAFPAAHITHIYASTEMGVCFSVHDGREGFPADFLDSDRLPVRLKIDNGRLWILSNRSMAGYLNGAAADRVSGRWYDTGDAVELRGDRVLFRGRESSRINVGGEKVFPEEIEAIIRRVEGVADVRVSGLASSIVGQLVQADVVPVRDADRDRLRRRIDEFCREQLAPYKRPRIVNFVDDLTRRDTMKISRRAGQT